ncbi:dipeptide epimerase [Polyangium mundeleinium]|uniref:Dipeptide epimerase n=1 Tax=Polyangium mundeleinium TaxID=2995306 RepID=A0ABT5ELG1_9BACT|nr:dipeptide epimerase [Polyangium mundeleinium]MDC0742654.1 dipeptide epimerase [Polyangium mundeleinium]
MFHVEAISVRPLSVPLHDPFVIATGRVTVTRSAEVRVTLAAAGARAEGLGEGAALWPVTVEDQPDVLAALGAARERLSGQSIALPQVDEALGVSLAGLVELGAALDDVLAGKPVARAALETALLDAWARLLGMPLRRLLGGSRGEATRRLETDITIPIAEPARMAELAQGWAARGFRHFKVKVGKDMDQDLAALFAIRNAVPDARFRIDANAGFSAAQAITMGRAVEARGLVVECWEQPCAADDLEGMAEVAAALAPPVIADESVKTLADLGRVRAARAADGVNLKLVKSGGPLGALSIGRAAKEAGMPIMIGGMVETRLGMTAGAHVAAALGGVDFVDLDTAWLLDGDPYRGGYEADGPRYELSAEPGLGVTAIA